MPTKKTYSVNEATLLLERYCIYQDRCHQEVEKKLKTIGMIPEAQEVILIHLIQQNFLNEERFAKSYARGKFYIKKWGKNKIVSGLKWRYISAHNIKVALLEIDAEDYIQTLRKLITKKKPLIKGKNKFEKKQKLIKYLVGKGYEFAVVIEELVIPS